MPTTQISLIREHTERNQAARALWVAFEMGRPLGVPGDAAFQTRVLTAVLELLEAPAGPVLVDYRRTHHRWKGPATLACPVSFSQPLSDRSDVEKLSATFMEEIGLMRPWYDRAVSARTRTTVGVSGLEPESVGSFIVAFLDGNVPSSPRGTLVPPLSSS